VEKEARLRGFPESCRLYLIPVHFPQFNLPFHYGFLQQIFARFTSGNDQGFTYIIIF